MSNFSAYHLRRIARTSLDSFKYRRALVDRRRFAPLGGMKRDAGSLASDGFTVGRQHFDTSMLIDIRERIDAEIDTNGRLLPIANDSVRAAGDRSSARAMLGPDELAQGQDVIRHLTNFVPIRDPILVAPQILDIALDDAVLDLIGGYFGCLPALSGINLRKSYANDLAEFDTNLFHVDGNSPDFLKLFVYLNDVDSRGGPTEIVRGSHRRKPLNWRHQYRWTYEELEPFYGRDAFVELVAQLGDFQVGNTTAFHRGKKVESRDRYMLTLNYSIHPEYFHNRVPAALISRDQAAAVPPAKRQLLEYCQMI